MFSDVKQTRTIGLSVTDKERCQDIMDASHGTFQELRHFYLFCMSLSVYLNKDSLPVRKDLKRDSIWHKATIDNDGVMEKSLQVVAPISMNENSFMEVVSCHAEWGINYLYDYYNSVGGEFFIEEVFEQIGYETKE
jgi:hypothetical protein